MSPLGLDSVQGGGESPPPAPPEAPPEPKPAAEAKPKAEPKPAKKPAAKPARRRAPVATKYIAITSGVAEYKGETAVFTKGVTLVAEGHWLLRRVKHAFEPVEEHVHYESRGT